MFFFKGGNFVNNLGLYIREKREQRNMTIEELSKRTLISPAVLKDIEEGKFDRYQGDEAYVKMYLKKISQALEMDVSDVTEQYVALTREIEIEKIKEMDEKDVHNMDVVKKGQTFVFDAPKLARKPSVYEKRSHLSIIKGAIIIGIICLIVAILWYGFMMTHSDDTNFKPQNGTNVDGEVDTNVTDKDDVTTPVTPPVLKEKVKFNRVDKLNYEFDLLDDVEEFTLKIEFRSKSWAKLTVNGKVYKEFPSKIYNNKNNENEPEVVELKFNVSEFKSLDLRNGYSMGHRYYINGEMVPLTDDDYSESPTNFKLVLKDELAQ